MMKEKVYNAIMGLVVGDALGVPYEFRERDTFKAEDMVGFGTHRQQPGTWSDDSSMTLATMHAIAIAGLSPNYIMHSFSRWVRFADFTAHSEVFDIGLTTHKAIKRYIDGTPPQKCGATSERENGNGALMRILPLAFGPHTAYDIHNIAGLTHAHQTSLYCCEIYVDVATNLLAGMRKRKAIFCALGGYWPEKFERLERLDELERDDIRSGGYVLDTLEAALWCVLKTDNYRDCVLTAVNLGEDTDTTAAVAGGLAGILYGVGGDRGIPKEWIVKIANYEEVLEICEAFAGCKWVKGGS